MIGFSVFSIVIIRSFAKTPTNEYQPDNAFTLVRDLSREQYGSTPLLYGQYYGAPYELDQKYYRAPLYILGKSILPARSYFKSTGAGAFLYFPFSGAL